MSVKPMEPTSYGSGEEVPLQTIGRLRQVPSVATLADPLGGGVSGLSTPSVDLSFLGYDSDDNDDLLGVRWRPPDTNGDVGLDYYVQWNNKGFKVFHKSNGALAAGPFIGTTFWTGFGGVCETDNGGDPIVLFDQFAERWLFSQFVSSSNPDGHQCIAISQGSDPLGPYYLYDYVFAGEFNDYPKFGVWTDAADQSSYFLSTNNFNLPGVNTFLGAHAVAFDRDAMLAGDPGAAMLDFGPLPCNGDCYYSILPAHLEGPELPPTGSCHFFVQAFDDEVWGNGLGDDGYQFWETCVDWHAPGNSTFTTGPLVPTAEFDAELCGLERCVPQSGTSALLDTLSQFTMNRFVVRYLSGTGPPPGLQGVVSHTVDLGSDRAGIRWARFALPSLAGASIADTGTYDVDDGANPLHRWIPAMGIDRVGNLALVYSRSGETSFPSVYFTSRETSDPAGTLRLEAACIDGTGSQTGSRRWGDYASVGVDPEDACTFWMTNEYVETTGATDWDTRVCTFRFASCTRLVFGDYLETGDTSVWTETQN